MACAASAASMPSATIASLKACEVVVRHEVVGEAHRDRVGGAERRARQRGVQAEQPGRARQDERAADVGDEADTDFGHGHFRGVGDDADAAVGADPDAAAHHDAVHQRDIRLAEAADLRVEQILVVPELSRLGPVGACAVIDRDDVAARAQPALAGAATPRPRGRRRRAPSRSSTRDIALTIGWVSELMALGRLRVIRPTPSSTVTRTSSFSATRMQSRSSPVMAQRRVGFSVKTWEVFREPTPGRRSLRCVRQLVEPQHRRGTDGAGDQQPGISFPAQGAGRICAIRYRSRRLRCAGGTCRPLCDAVPRPAADRGFPAADHRRRRHQDRHHARRADGRRGRLLLPGRAEPGAGHAVRCWSACSAAWCWC